MGVKDNFETSRISRSGGKQMLWMKNVPRGRGCSGWLCFLIGKIARINDAAEYGRAKGRMRVLVQVEHLVDIILNLGYFKLGNGT
jgi:hypothetical protein